MSPSLAEGADALVFITQNRQQIDPLPESFIEQWWYRDDSDIERAFKRRGPQGLSFRNRRKLLLLHAQRLALQAAQKQNPDRLHRAVEAMTRAWLQVAADSSNSPAEKQCAQAAAVELNRGRTSPALKKAGALPTKPANASQHAESVLGCSWDLYVELVRSIRAAMDLPDVPSFAIPDLSGVPTALLRRARDRNRAANQAPLSKPTTEISTPQVLELAVTGVRGVAKPRTFHMSENGQPASCVILGGTGTGKTSVVAAMEYALQGRMGRSFDLEGPLAPSAGSLTAEGPGRVEVKLSNGQTVTRAVPPHHSDVRPDFRHAPLSISRTDLVRFADSTGRTGAQVFFDYFPPSAGSDAVAMAPSPLEEQRRAESEAYLLSAHRSILASQLRERFGTTKVDFGDRCQLLAYLKSNVLEGKTVGQAVRSGSWKALPDDRRSLLEDQLAVTDRLAQLQREGRLATAPLDQIGYQRQASTTQAALTGVGDALSRAFTKITRSRHVKRIDVVTGSAGPASLDVFVTLRDGTITTPAKVLSSGQQELVALLFFVAMAQQATSRGQARVLAFDDAFTGLDARLRTATLDWLLGDLEGWQLLITTSDEDWFTNVSEALSRRGFPCTRIHIRGWTAGTGPTLEVEKLDHGADLRETLRRGTPHAVGPMAGRLLSTICHELSWRLPVQVTRRQHDRYTTADLWPPVSAALSITTAGPEVEALQATVTEVLAYDPSLWTDVAGDRTGSLARCVLALYDRVWCKNCGGWLEPHPAGLRCHCEQTRV